MKICMTALMQISNSDRFGPRLISVRPVSQENLSPGNCVAATVFPKEMKSLQINVATVYPKEILSPGNTVARMLAIGIYILSEKACNL